jgi:hypothetical protein
MPVFLNMLSLQPGGGFVPTTPQTGRRPRDVAQTSTPNPAGPASRPLVDINFAAQRGASGPEPQARPTPVEISRLAPEQTTMLRYHAVANAIRRLIAGAAISKAALLVVLVCLLAGLSQGITAEAPTSKEYQIKAAFLYNFAKFIEWPARAHQDATSPLVIGVFGKNPFGSELEKAVKDRKINGREILVKSIQSANDSRSVHLLFVGAGEDEHLNSLREALKGTCVVTVGESDAFARQGGIILFSLEADKVRFEINMDAAEKAELKISAQLQKLAKAIKRQS